MTDSEAKAHIIVPLSRKVGIRATTHIAQSWRSVIGQWGRGCAWGIASSVVCGAPRGGRKRERSKERMNEEREVMNGNEIKKTEKRVGKKGRKEVEKEKE